MRVTANVGSNSPPSNAPVHQYRHQLQTGSPSDGTQPRTPSTILPTSIAIMPPPKKPTISVRHPTPIYGQTVLSVGGAGGVP